MGFARSRIYAKDPYLPENLAIERDGTRGIR